MIRILSHIFNNITSAGINTSQSARQRNNVELINRIWLVMVLVQFFILVLHIIQGIYISAIMTAVFLSSLALVHFFMRKGHVNTGKITAIIAINLNTTIMAVVFGEQTHLIDFLMLGALLPLYFFEIKDKKMIFLGMAASVIPLAVYHLITPYITSFALPADIQLSIYHTTNWVKQICLITLLYLIYNKNVAYEKEVSEKEKELMGQKKLYERILDQIPVGIITYDVDLNFTYVNSSAIKMPIPASG